MLKNMTSVNKKFGVLAKSMQFFGLRDNSKLEQATIDPRQFGSPFPEKPTPLAPLRHTASKLDNGVRVVTENSPLAGQVTMGVMIDMGTRDETKENSGALHSIKTTYFKSHLNTNETINYGMVQMSGARYDMGFDRELTWFKASCLPHDVVDIFSMMGDCVLEPRSFVAAGAAMEKLGHSHKLHQVRNSSFLLTDKLLGSVFGEKGLGMPLLGHEKNISNLTAFELQKFQLENISPDRLIVCGLGVENHGEFSELVNNIYGKLRSGASRTREASVFREADVRARVSGLGKAEALVAFESSSWKNGDIVMAQLAREVLGAADVSNPESREQNYGILSDSVYANSKSVMAVDCFNLHFTDAGIFGFRVQAGNDALPKALESLAKAVKNFSKLSEADLSSAKKRLKRRAFESLADDYLRIEEIMRHENVFGENKLKDFFTAVDGATSKSLADWAAKLTKSKMAFILESSDPASAPSYTKVRELFK